jgi:hypothetical protein
MQKDHLEVLLEEISGKFDLVLEGHEVLRSEIRQVRDESNEKHDHTAFLITALNGKIDSVDQRLGGKIDTLAAELAEHRKDTEAHHNVYRVREE